MTSNIGSVTGGAVSEYYSEHSSDIDSVGLAERLKETQKGDLALASGRSTPAMRGRLRQDKSQFMRYSGVSNKAGGKANAIETRLQQLCAAPLFSAKVEDALAADPNVAAQLALGKPLYPQFSMLGNRIGELNKMNGNFDNVDGGHPDSLVFLNMNEPFSTFICGSQGSGKSHTLSCMLEGALLRNNPVGNIEFPSAAMVFHYDQFSSHVASQVCEAAYLSSPELSVRVMVSPTNYNSMVKLYSNLPGLEGKPKPRVIPFHIKESQLSTEIMKKLMSCAEPEVVMPLYLERVFSILKDMAMERRVGFDYNAFRSKLKTEKFSKEQRDPLEIRLSLVDDFLKRYQRLKLPESSKTAMNHAWTFEAGSLTIVDLSCPFISVADACSMFSVALSLFLESRKAHESRVIVLDEAHKFLSDQRETAHFTADLISVIAQQRHLAARVIIATQEPTLSPRLLELSNVTIVHRFASPRWFEALKQYLAGSESSTRGAHRGKLFEEIVRLSTGEALVFAPTALIKRDAKGKSAAGIASVKAQGTGVSKIVIRKRVTVDGGKSVTMF